jgi:DNA-binding SARP family transcriptional activator/dipeptidyl aminopeptidase/acylaminoacyl peptidase
MPVIEFRTLGTLDLRAADGRELHSLLAQPKRIALLAYLCIAHPRGFHRRDTLLGLFWPDADQEHARTSLRKSLHLLRRALGDDAIVSRGDEEVAVDFQRVSCDVAVFEESIKAERPAEALELYRGDLLAGFFIDEAPEFEHWLHSERTRMRASAARTSLTLSDQLEDSGDFADAITWARRSLELSDTDEHALRRVIELQYRAGDRAGAIKAYDTFVRRLAAEYQTEPSLELSSLIERIRSGAEPLGREREAKAVVSRELNDERTSPTPSTSRLTAEASRRKERKTRGAMAYVGAVIAIVLLSSAIWGWMRPTPSKQVLRYTLAVDSAEAVSPGLPWTARLAISPDGSRFAYIGGPNAQLLIRPRDQLHAAAVPASEGASTPFFSPDGRQVGFLREKQVYIASLGGALPIAVTDSLTGVAGASWGADGFIYVDGKNRASLVRVEAKSSASPKRFTVLDSAAGEVDHMWPDVLPNGKGVLFTVAFNGIKGKSSHAIAVADIPSGKHRVIVNDATYGRYSTSGHLLYVASNKALMVVPFDQNSMRVTGEPTALSEGMRLNLFGSADLAVSATGTLVYSTGAEPNKQELVWVTRDGKAQSVDPEWQGDFRSPALSPDGKRLAVTNRFDDVTRDLWIKQLDRGPSIKLTPRGTFNSHPAWTPDGRSVTFTSNAAGSADLWTRRADGSTQGVLQFRDRGGFAAQWSPDAKWLVYVTDDEGPSGGDIVGIRPGIDKVPVPFVATKFHDLSPAFSPDGRNLAYSSDETGRDEIYVVPFPNTSSAKWAISTRGGADPQWSHSGKELFYRDPLENFVAVDIKTVPTLSIGRSTVLFSTGGFASLPWGPRYSVAPDGRFLMIRQARPSFPDTLIVVDNWFEELKGKSKR